MKKRTSLQLIIFLGLMILLSCQSNDDQPQIEKPNEKFVGTWVGNAARHKVDIDYNNTYDTLYGQTVIIEKGSGDSDIIVHISGSTINTTVSGSNFDFSRYYDNGSSTGSGALIGSGTNLIILKHDIVDFINIGVYDQYYFM